MTTLFEVRHVSVSIACSPNEVYRRTYDVSTWVTWAHGLGTSVARQGDQWRAHGPLGDVTISLAPENPFGVLDHDVTLPSGQTVHNVFRVLPNGSGSEVVFSVFRQPNTSDESFCADTSAVERDLRTLKALLETR